MSQPKVSFKLGPGVEDLCALGIGTPDALFEGDSALVDEKRAERVSSTGGASLLRYPLPGTPQGDGPLTGRPRGSGTGFVYLRRYASARVTERMRARFSKPPSQSLAEREWNLICHLRRFGVATPEPLAVGHLGDGVFSERSFIVTRELDGFLPLATWLEHTRGDDSLQRRGAVALGQALARLFDSGALLPRLALRHLHLWHEPEDECALKKLDQARAEHGVLHPHKPEESSGQRPRLWLRRLPEVAITGFRDGSLQRRIDLDQRLELFGKLYRELSEDSSESLAPRMRTLCSLVAVHALDREFPRHDRAARRRGVERVGETVSFG